MTNKEARDALIYIKASAQSALDAYYNGRKVTDAFDVAIKALEQEQYYKDLAESYEKTINKLTNAIAEQEPKTEWIPVRVRLPENNKDVIALLSSGRITKAEYNYHKLPFSNEPIGWGYVNNEGYIDFLNEEVIAWMPLPEPYKESEVEE